MVGVEGGLLFLGTDKAEPLGQTEDLVNEGKTGDVEVDDSDSDKDLKQTTSQASDAHQRQSIASTPPAVNAKKSIRVPGGRPAVPKRILADYDSDDGRIINLKQQGYTDEFIAEKLIEEGRIRYVPKTVGSRWLRLRKALGEVEDEKLDDELSDWHVDEDDHLQEAWKNMNEKHEAEKQKLKDREWKDVSMILADRLARQLNIKHKKYTAKACEERMRGLENGTALLPIELDPDQDGRKVMRERRITAAKQLRVQQAMEAQLIEEQKKAHLNGKKQRDAEKSRQKVAEAHKRQAEKLEEATIQKERKQAAEKQRAAKRAILAQQKLELDWRKKQIATEKKIIARYKGAGWRRRPCETRRVRFAPLPSISTSEDEGFQGHLADDSDDDEEKIAGNETTGFTYDDPAVLSPNNAPKAATVAVPAKVTQETLRNPRSIMAINELAALLLKRNLPPPTAEESHPQIVARLAATDASLSHERLSDLLRVDFLKMGGSKAARIQRLQEHDAEESMAGRAGLKATDPTFQAGYQPDIGMCGGLIGKE